MFATPLFKKTQDNNEWKKQVPFIQLAYFSEKNINNIFPSPWFAQISIAHTQNKDC